MGKGKEKEKEKEKEKKYVSNLLLKSPIDLHGSATPLNYAAVILELTPLFSDSTGENPPAVSNDLFVPEWPAYQNSN